MKKKTLKHFNRDCNIVPRSSSIFFVFFQFSISLRPNRLRSIAIRFVGGSPFLQPISLCPSYISDKTKYNARHNWAWATFKHVLRMFVRECISISAIAIVCCCWWKRCSQKGVFFAVSVGTKQRNCNAFMRSIGIDGYLRLFDWRNV